MKKKRTWILLADGARARIVERADADHYRELGAFDLIGDNRPSRDHGSDRPGRSFDSHGNGRHAMEPPSDPKMEEQRRLAHRLSSLLHQELQEDSYDQLIIIAAPHMLGNLRQALMEDVKRVVIEEINKDITRLSGLELDKQLAGMITRVH